jgi:hypothetical protein
MLILLSTVPMTPPPPLPPDLPSALGSRREGVIPDDTGGSAKVGEAGEKGREPGPCDSVSRLSGCDYDYEGSSGYEIEIGCEIEIEIGVECGKHW